MDVLNNWLLINQFFEQLIVEKNIFLISWYIVESIILFNDLLINRFLIINTLN